MKKLKLLIASLLIGGAAFAQCAANYTFAVNPANNGDVQFTGTAMGLGTPNYFWSFGDGTSGFGANPNHVFNTGIWMVCLTVADSSGGGCTSTFCDSVSVLNNTNPGCSAFFAPYDSLGYGYFYDMSVGAGLSYLWDFGDNTSSTNTGTTTHLYNANGTYYVCLTISNTFLGCTSTYCDTVTIGNPGGGTCAASYYSVNDAVGNGVSFYSSVSGTADTYTWDFGDGGTSSQANPYYVYGTIGTYTACLTVTSSTDTSCYYTACNTIAVGNNTGCNAYFMAFDSLGYGYFWDQSTGNPGLTYFWDFGDGTSSSNTGNTTHLYSANGTYTVCLTITNSFLGCTSTYCDSVVISNMGSTCSGYFYSVNDAVGNGVSFYSSVSGSVDTYSWDFGDGNTSTAANPYYVYGSAGTYYACLTVSSSTDTACHYTDCQTITTGNPAGGCSANFVIIQDSTNLYNYWVYSYANSNNLTTYFWSFGDGTSSALQYPSHTYSGSGPYTLCLTVTDSTFAGLCTATYCDSIWPGHGVNQVTTLNVYNPATIGIAEHNALTESLENYPNPFTGSTTIAYTVNQNTAVELSLSDLLGNKIAVIETGNKTSGSYKTTFDASSVSAGIYLLQLKTDTKLTTKKLVIAK